MHLLTTASLPSHTAAAAEIQFSKPRTLNSAGWLLDLDQRCAIVGNVDVGLSPLEFAMVHLLVANRGIPMTKEAIAAFLPVQVDPRMIDVYVTRSRAKLAAAGLDDAIRTVWGRGYMACDYNDDPPADPPPSCDLDATLVPA